MQKITVVLALPLALLMSISNVQSSEISDRILEQARSDCQSFENGNLTIDAAAAVSSVDVTGDGVADEVVDSSAFSCTTAQTLFCGTGGCQLTVIVGDQPFEFLAKAWRVGEASNLLETAVHWSECDYASVCWESHEWNGTKFDSQGFRVEKAAMSMDFHETEWVLQDFGDGNVTIEFASDGAVSGQAPCNRYNGTAKGDYPQIAIGPLTATRMACPELAEETAYFEHLAGVTTSIVDGDTLTLIRDDGTTLTFKR